MLQNSVKYLNLSKKDGFLKFVNLSPLNPEIFTEKNLY